MKVKVCFNDVSTVEISRSTVSISCYCRYVIVDTAKPMKVKVCFNDVSSIQWKSPGRLFRYLIIVDAAKSMKVKVCFDDVSTVEISRPTVSISCYCRYSKAEVVYILI